MEIQSLPQHLVPPGRLHFVGHSGFVQFGAVKIGLGMLLPEIGQHAAPELLDVGGVLQSQPERGSVKVSRTLSSISSNIWWISFTS